MKAMLLPAIVCLSFLCLGLPDSLLGSAWPSMYGGLGAPVSCNGVLSMIISGGTVWSSLFSERRIKRLGTGRVVAVSVLMTAAALLGFSISGRFGQLCLWAVPLGLGAGAVDAALNNYVALHFEARHMSWLHCLWGVGATAGPVVLSAFLATGGGWRRGYRAIGLLQLGLVVLLFFALPLWRGREEPSGKGAEKADPSLGIAALLRLPGVKAALLCFFCYSALEQLANLWGGSYLVLARGVAPDVAARWVSLFFLGITAGRLASGFLSIRLNARRMIWLGQGVMACGLLALLPSGDRSAPAGLFLLGLGCGPVFPNLLHETPRNFGAGRSQAVMGVQMACAYTGSTLMPPLFGAFAAAAGYRWLPAVLGGLLLLLAVMTGRLNRRADGARPA